MAKISIYPKVVPPSLDDFVVGTDVSDSLATKSFLISDILSLRGTPTLQQVTNAGATTTTSITTTGFIKTGGTSSQFLMADGNTRTIPYKVYTALLSQSGTSAPTLVVLENTLGDTITSLYNGVGNYTLQLATLNLFTSTKTFILLNSSYNSNAYLGIVRGDDNELLVTAAYNGSSSNNVISGASIEIRVYN